MNDEPADPVGSPEHLASMSEEERAEYEMWSKKIEQEILHEQTANPPF